MKTDLDVLREHIEVEQIIDYYDLDGHYSGDQFIGLCPFHNDSHASFSFNSDTGLWRCFGCGLDGNVYTFVQQIENYNKFGYAIKKIKEIIGYKDTDSTSLNYTKQIIDLFNNPRKTNKKKKDKIKIRGSLPEEAVSAIEYLDLAKKRVTKRMIKLYSIKYAPSGKYEGCLIIPIFYNKKIVGYFARDLLGKQQKSKKYSYGTPINEVFFNWDLCKKGSYVILTEGMLDCLKVCSFGYNSLALLGTHLSLKKKLMLLNNFDSVYFALDNDRKEKIINGIKVIKNPGQEAVKKLSAMLIPEIPTYNILLPQGKDPDECTREEFNEAFKNAKRF